MRQLLDLMPGWAWFWVVLMVPVAVVYPVSLIPYLVWLTAIVYLAVKSRRRGGKQSEEDRD